MYRAVRELAHGHTAREWQHLDFNPGSVEPLLSCALYSATISVSLSSLHEWRGAVFKV